MSKTTNLFLKNAETFYNFRTGTRTSIAKRYTIIIFISVILGVVFAERSDNLYLGIITAQSILAGFGFNVMVSLAFNRVLQKPADVSIERGAKFDQVNLLGKELFYNVSYFSAVAVASILLSIMLLLAPALWSGWDKACKSIMSLIAINDTSSTWWIELFDLVVRRITIVSLYVIVIESFATFIRTVYRASRYFESRIKLDSVGR